jgi:hypothetical protein
MSFEHLQYLTTYSFSKKIRLGNKHDGGYVIANGIGDYDCYISAGIGNDESFSYDFLQNYKVKNTAAFQLDIDVLPKNYPVEMVHYKRNVSSVSDNKHANLSFFMKNYNNIFLKMNMEGNEYLWLDYVSVNDLKKFKQLLVKFHGINDDTWNCDYKTKVNVFKKLSETHYIIHAHGNKHQDSQLKTEVNIPSVIEFTFIRKDLLENPKLNTYKLPMNIDYPNDVDLNFPPFVNNTLTINDEKDNVDEPVTESVTEDVTEYVTETVTEYVTEPVTEYVTEDVDESVTEPVAEDDDDEDDDDDENFAEDDDDEDDEDYEDDEDAEDDDDEDYEDDEDDDDDEDDEDYEDDEHDDEDDEDDEEESENFIEVTNENIKVE